MSFKLEILYPDNTVYWTENFNTITEQEKWLTEEQTRPYWQSSFTFTVTEIVTPPVDPEIIRVNEIKAKGAKSRLACQNVLDTISGHNQMALLTAEQITQMTTTFSPVVQALMIYRPGLAKGLITAITPDEVIITTQLKADVLAELADY